MSSVTSKTMIYSRLRKATFPVDAYTYVAAGPSLYALKNITDEMSAATIIGLYESDEEALTHLNELTRCYGKTFIEV